MTTLADIASAQTKRLGRAIRERRKELGLSQPELAGLIPGKPDSQYVSKWERGANRPSDDNLDLIAAALQTTVPELVAGPPSERPAKGATPDLLGQYGKREGTQLDRIEEMLIAVLAHLEADVALASAEEEQAANAEQQRTRKSRRAA